MVMTSGSDASRLSAIPALVLGSGITALGVVRSLGRENIPVYYSSSQRDFVSRSRWCSFIPNSLCEFSGAEQLNRFLRGLPYARMVVFPCSDSLVQAIAGLDPEVAMRFPSSISSQENHDMLSDKGCFARVLDLLDLPHPRTVLLNTVGDLKSAIDADIGDTFLKSRRSQEFSAHFGVKAFRIKSGEEALERYAEIQMAGLSVVLQEYIPGPPIRHYFVEGFVDRNQRICAHFVRQRLRANPVDFGNSTYTISVAPQMSSPAIKTMDRLLSSIRYRGIYSAEFKYDERDGLFKILEVNARPWWYVEFASICGINVCKMAYEDALDRPIEPLEGYKVKRKCVYLNYDVLSCLRLYRKRQLTISAWIKSWWGANQPDLSRDDPMPGIWNILIKFQQFILHRLVGKKVARKKRGLT